MPEPSKITAACPRTLASPRRLIRRLAGAPIGKKTGVGEPAPARLRVANPRQGDFAKPDCENEGGRPASRLRC